MFTWENSHQREFHTGVTFWFCIPFTWWLGHFISRYLKVHFMSIEYTCDSKSQTLHMRYLFQSTSRPTSQRNVWSFCVYMIPLWEFVLESNSRSSTTTRVNSCWGDSRQHDILWRYHVNKCRPMRGNQSELAPGRKSPRCHVNTPLLDCSWLRLFKFAKITNIKIARWFVCLFSENLKQLITSSKECGITFYYALSPGLDISFSSSRDIHMLQRKMDQVWHI